MSRNLEVQFHDGKVVEVEMGDGDRIILQVDHALSDQMRHRLLDIVNTWLNDPSPVLILDAGVKIAVVRALNYVKS
jgi:hypothetical protein